MRGLCVAAIWGLAVLVEPTLAHPQGIKDAQVSLKDVEDTVDEGMPGGGVNSAAFMSVETSMKIKITNNGSNTLEIGALSAKFFRDEEPMCETRCYVAEVEGKPQYQCIYNGRGKSEIDRGFVMAGRVAIAPNRTVELPLDTANCNYGRVKSDQKRSVMIGFMTQGKENIGTYKLDIPPTKP